MNHSGDQDAAGTIAELLERVLELERRVLALGDEPPADEGCCTVLCCDTNPFQDIAPGGSADFCSRTLEETAGNALRLVTTGFVVVRAGGTAQIWFDVSVVVDGSAYLWRPLHLQNMTNGDLVTVPITNTIDVNTAAPVVAVRVRNLNVTTINVRYVNVVTLVYGVRDGTLACGEPAGTL